MTCARGCCPSPALHYKSVTFTPRLHSATLTERGWDKDMPAYKRLRADGIQPRDIDGCAKLEARADTSREIETGQLLTPPQRRQVSEMLGD